jgi:prolipoprotein diacylglyceryltransferase
MSSLWKRGDFGPIALIRTRHFTITTFGVLVGLGFFLAALHTWFYLGYHRIFFTVDQLSVLAGGLTLAIPTGAYTMSRFLELPRLLKGELTLKTFIRVPGFALWGGLLAGILFILLTSYHYGWNPRQIFDAIVLGLPLAQGLGRIGCLNYGCCHGRPTHGKKGLRYFHKDSKVLRTYSHLRGISLYPTQIYSAIGNTFIYVILLSITFSGEPVATGFLTAVYLVLYGTKRLVVEYFRGEYPRTKIFSLSLWQLFSIGFIAVGVALLLNIHPLPTPRLLEPALSEGIAMIKALIPLTLLTTILITVVYSLQGRKIGSW